jgi:hypothetical protein
LFDSAGMEEPPQPPDEKMELINKKQRGMLFFKWLCWKLSIEKHSHKKHNQVASFTKLLFFFLNKLFIFL